MSEIIKDEGVENPDWDGSEPLTFLSVELFSSDEEGARVGISINVPNDPELRVVMRSALFDALEHVAQHPFIVVIGADKYEFGLRSDGVVVWRKMK